MNSANGHDAGWRLVEIEHVEGEVLLLLDRARLAEARKEHPDAVIYVPEEIAELARNQGAPDHPDLVRAVHALKSAFRGWLMPQGIPGDGPADTWPPRPDPCEVVVTPEAIAQVDEIRDRALSLGWTHESLYSTRGRHPFPCGSGYGLVSFLRSGRSVGEVTREVDRDHLPAVGPHHIASLLQPGGRSPMGPTDRSMSGIRVARVRFSSASLEQMRQGLLGYATFDLNGEIQVDGVAVRRSRQGRLYVSFPARRDSRGNDHPYVRPIDDCVRREIEREILRALPFLEDDRS